MQIQINLFQASFLWTVKIQHLLSPASDWIKPRDTNEIIFPLAYEFYLPPIGIAGKKYPKLWARCLIIVHGELWTCDIQQDSSQDIYGLSNLISILGLVILLEVRGSDLDAGSLEAEELLAVEAEHAGDLGVVVTLHVPVHVSHDPHDGSAQGHGHLATAVCAHSSSKATKNESSCPDKIPLQMLPMAVSRILHHSHPYFIYEVIMMYIWEEYDVVMK